MIPPTKCSVDFTKEETELTQVIQFIVERVIARVKSSHIRDSPVPPTLTGCVNQIWNNCCVLANYRESICLMN